MKRHAFVVLCLPILCAVAAGCRGPNAYKGRDANGFGYAGEFSRDAQKANAAFVTFVGDEHITDETLAKYCMRRAEKLCRKTDYDYFSVTDASFYPTTGLKEQRRYWGRTRDAHGNEYTRWKVWKEKVPARGRRMSFLAFRGPMPTGSAWRVHSARPGKRPPPVRCEQCGDAAHSVRAPERCPAGKHSLFRSVPCPYCDDPVMVRKPGRQVCGSCDRGFRVADCPHCGARHVLRDFRPFNCSLCRMAVDTEPKPGANEFPCPHCGATMVWPEELSGEHQCTGCRRVFFVKRCPKCRTPNAEQTATAFSCSCGFRIRPSRPTK